MSTAPTKQEQEIQRLQKQLLKICPDQEQEIMMMNKEDLEELLAIVMGDHQGKEKGKLGRDYMEKEILKVCPDMEQELRNLGEEDIEDIYNSFLSKKEQPPKNIVVNGEVNVAQMKKVLIDKLPAYKYQIRGMNDEEIKKMFAQLQEESKIGTKTLAKTDNKLGYVKPKQSNKISRIGQQNGPRITIPYDLSTDYMPKKSLYPQLIQKDFPLQSKKNSQNEKVKVQIPTPIPRSATPAPSKAKKPKHKCKITFYLDQSDFEDQDKDGNKGQGEKRLDIIAKIVQSLSFALDKKSWNQNKDHGNQQIKQPSKQNVLANNAKQDIPQAQSLPEQPSPHDN